MIRFNIHLNIPLKFQKNNKNKKIYKKNNRFKDLKIKN